MANKYQQTQGHQARKRFGQNFLQDQSVIDAIVAEINPQAKFKLVEIGPGLGALTKPVLAQAGELDVVELDRDLIPKLQQMAQGVGQLTIHEADALQFDFSKLFSDRPLSVFGNLPYNISTPLIFHLCSFNQQVAEMHFMLQKEVVQRMAAEPGSKRYGRLTVMTQYYCDVEQLFLVPPSAFVPAPKVDSAIVRLIPHRQKPFVAKDEKLFAQLVTAAFNMRRKTARNVFKEYADEQQLQAAGIDASKRPEAIPLEQFVALENLLSEA